MILCECLPHFDRPKDSAKQFALKCLGCIDGLIALSKSRCTCPLPTPALYVERDMICISMINRPNLSICSSLQSTDGFKSCADLPTHRLRMLTMYEAIVDCGFIRLFHTPTGEKLQRCKKILLLLHFSCNTGLIDLLSRID